MYHIRKGRKEDIPQIVRIYDALLKEEEEGKNVIGWIRGVYPTEKTAEDAWSAEELFVLELDKKVAAAARINQIQVPEYRDAPWNDPHAPEQEIMVLHTLVVDPAQKGKGCGSAFVRFYESYALEHGCPYLRMDTNARNAAARRLYAHLGYREVGIVPCVFNGIPDVSLVCLEKYLISEEK